MKLRKHTNYSLEIDDNTFPLPFDPEGDPQHVYIAPDGLTAVLAFLVRDDSPEDPFDGDEGEFYQFNSRSIHYEERPDIDKFKRLIRANPCRVFTHDGTDNCHGPGTTRCKITAGPFTVADTKGTDSPAEQALDNAYGYYIAPDDVTDPTSYARSTLETYSQWCNGEVYGCIVWTYTRDSIAEQWGEPDRDRECWGYYGYDGYTADNLLDEFTAATAQGVQP